MAQHRAGKAKAGGDVAVPAGVNHVVLNVRDIEVSHKFWTEIIGLRHVGTWRPRPELESLRVMRFYSGSRGGKPAHHDVALVEDRNLPPRAAAGEGAGPPQALDHVAIAMPDRDSWLKKLSELKDNGVEFGFRANHGVSHSVYITDPDGHCVELLYELPRELWEGDIDEALNYLEILPTEGEDALQDDADNLPKFPADAE